MVVLAGFGQVPRKAQTSRHPQMHQKQALIKVKQ
jgi:hypothetical protein